MSASNEFYLIVYGDNASDLYTFGVPDAFGGWNSTAAKSSFGVPDTLGHSTGAKSAFGVPDATSIWNSTGVKHTFGVPDASSRGATAAPATRTLFRSVPDAKRGLETLRSSFDDFVLTAYGQAYPFEHSTFEQELTRSGFAI